MEALDGRISDAKLLANYVKSKDDRSFDRLTARYHKMMLATAIKICGHSDAADAVQKALITFSKKAPEIRSSDAIGAWLYRCVSLEAMALTRKNALHEKKQKEIQSILPNGSDNSASNLINKLHAEMNNLAQKDQSVLVLHYFEGKSFPEIANQLGGSSVAWQKRGRRAIEKLSKKLNSRGSVASTAAVVGVLGSGRSEAAHLTESLKSSWSLDTLRKVSSTIPHTPVNVCSPTLFFMKTNIIVSIITFAVGFTLAAAIESNKKSRASLDQVDDVMVASTMVNTKSGPRTLYSNKFDLIAVLSALRELDVLPEGNPQEINKLSMLMFYAEKEHLEELHEFLASVNNKNRFRMIATNLFGRWAEINPEEAWNLLAHESTFSKEARKGVLLTHLHMDSEAALSKILSQKSPQDIALIGQYFKGQINYQPERVAEILDTLAIDWSEADRKLFKQVALDWAYTDAESAAAWVATHQDQKIRNKLLMQISHEKARVSGMNGLKLADYIDDPKVRQQARMQALRWWSISSAGWKLRNNSKKLPAQYDIPKGFYPDWTDQEIQQFSSFAMVNFSKEYPKLVELAKDDYQRELVNQAVIKGAKYGVPSYITGAVENISNTFAYSPDGKKLLQSYIKRWEEIAPGEASVWLETLPKDEKYNVLKNALK